MAASSAAGCPRRVESIFLNTARSGSCSRSARAAWRAAAASGPSWRLSASCDRTASSAPGPASPHCTQAVAPRRAKAMAQSAAPVRSSARMSQRRAMAQARSGTGAASAGSTAPSAGSPKCLAVQAVASGVRIAVTTTVAATSTVAGAAASA